VVRTRPPSSAQPGMRAVVEADGEVRGWVGGHCTQEAVRRAGLRTLATGEPEVVLLRPSLEEPVPQGVRVEPMTCHSGGEVELFVEPHLPLPELWVVGATPIAWALAQLAPTAGFRPRQEAWSPPDSLETFCHELEERMPAGAWVVVATMGDYDEEAAQVAARRHPRYLGVVASPRRAQLLRERLQAHLGGPEALEGWSAPAGLDLGAREPGEIAVSILAEVIQRRRARKGAPPVPTPIPQVLGAPVVDVVCGMEVDPSTSPHQMVHEGQTYVFCSALCRERFAQDPQAYRPVGSRAHAT
jgi:xanthine dehydrogenase accessory factor